MISEIRSMAGAGSAAGCHFTCRSPHERARTSRIRFVVINALVYWARRFVKDDDAAFTRTLENRHHAETHRALFGAESPAAALAEAAAEGAKGVRFTEVDRREPDGIA